MAKMVNATTNIPWYFEYKSKGIVRPSPKIEIQSFLSKYLFSKKQYRVVINKSGKSGRANRPAKEARGKAKKRMSPKFLLDLGMRSKSKKHEAICRRMNPSLIDTSERGRNEKHLMINPTTGGWSKYPQSRC